MLIFQLSNGIVFLLLISSHLLVTQVYSEVQIPQAESSISSYDFVELTRTEQDALGYIGKLIGLGAGDISAILAITKIGLGLIGALDKIFTRVFNGSSIDLSFLDRPGADKDLLAMFQIITYRLDQIQSEVEGIELSLQSLVRGLPNMIRWEIALNTLEEYARPINGLYHRFAYYQKHKDRIENHTLMNFAESVVSHDTQSIQALMANIHSLTAPSDPPYFKGGFASPQKDYNAYSKVSSRMGKSEGLHKLSRLRDSEHAESSALMLRPSIFLMLKDAIENYDNCGLNQTPQQLILGMYTLVAITQARAFSMVNFSWTLLKFHKEGNFTMEHQLISELYTHYSKGLLREALNVMELVPNSFRRCDPLRGEHKEGETFEMVTELLQGYIENEVDMNPSGTCGHKCASYEHSPVFGCYLPKQQFCGKHRRCRGNVHNCTFVDSDAWVCLSDLRERRYNWVKYENLNVLGKEDSCTNIMKVDSWWRFLFHCSYCMCLCDDPVSETTDRFFSLMPSVSDIANNMVVIGVRFTKKNRIVHIQVEEGKAMPQGMVDPSSRRWRDVEPMTLSGKKYKDGIHYKTMRFESRNIDLDKLTAPTGHVITGVKFRALGPHINMEVWVTPVNFTSGMLVPSMSYWISNDNTPIAEEASRKRIYLNYPDDPRKSSTSSLQTNPTNTYIKFEPTAMWKDVSQLTVPFLDAQKVSTYPGAWLGGVEIHHRGPKFSGGFIGFKIFNYNITKHFELE